ncbi:PepSY domain-containing protein [Tardiphaga alba]|uniref:PepSY domain-containing protein n=1 Tax=Tardiphaga alba TaxID=340268 RepID=A0ABX8AI33_9BRAD|nr:PepSY domain-containing protein [Tardiphaga alba]QUS42055.1 PepSY domain-containing protein [Tardiphaga alba]
MKCHLGVLTAIGFCAIASTLAIADQPGADWITKDQAIQKLKSMSYTDVRKLDADDGHWEGDAVKDDKTYEIHMDPKTGALTKNELKR